MDDAVLCSAPASLPTPHRRYATERWVEAVCRGARSPEDPKTLESWARLAGTSRSALSSLCRAVDIPPRRARDFTRLLRAFIMTGGDPAELHDVLDIAERQTAVRLFERAGLQYRAMISPLDFLNRQHLVRNIHALDTLKQRLQQLIIDSP
jgi:hypothetical protein